MKNMLPCAGFCAIVFAGTLAAPAQTVISDDITQSTCIMFTANATHTYHVNDGWTLTINVPTTAGGNGGGFYLNAGVLLALAPNPASPPGTGCSCFKATDPTQVAAHFLMAAQLSYPTRDFYLARPFGPLRALGFQVVVSAAPAALRKSPPNIVKM